MNEKERVINKLKRIQKEKNTPYRNGRLAILKEILKEIEMEELKKQQERS